jgi:UPF0755 protein
MNNRAPKFAWWEYPLYAAVALVFAVLGVVVVVLKFLQVLWRMITWPVRRLLRLAITVVFALIIVAGVSIYLYTNPVDLGSRVVTVIIKPGDDLGTVAAELRRQGVIRTRSMLTYSAEWLGIDRTLTPGRYDFSGRVSVLAVLEKLRAADLVRVKITVYEGAPIWRVAGILARALEADSNSIMRLCKDSSFARSLDLPYLEGYLYPETYVVPWGTPPELVVGEMVRMFRAKTDSLWSAPLPPGMSREAILKLASIIQAETRLEAELPKVSSVYLNRLRLRMRLDADPTVIYGLGGLTRPLMRADLKLATPYNTYVRHGLPPTPINSPGLPAIRAALRPDTSKYLYFVADGSGGHRFSRTNAEQNTARREIKRALRLNKKS